MIYHISHIDLDGYGCQFVTGKLFKNITFINANYNKSIEDTLDSLFYLLSSSEDPSIHEILITDINLSLAQAEKVDRFSKGFNVKVTLLDHHITGAESAEKFFWYHLSDDVCATKLTYQYFFDLLEKNLSKEALESLDMVVETVNAYDLWKEDSHLFSKGKLLNSLILDNKSRFSKLIEGESHKYIFYMFDEIGKKLGKESVSSIEKSFYDISKNFLEGKIHHDYYSNDDHTLDYLFNRYVFESVKEREFPKVKLNGLTGKVFTDMYGGLFQDFSHFYLREFDDVDFVVHVSDRGQLSFRSVGDVDVSNIANTYFGGGGHANASGASLGERLSNLKIEEALTLIQKAKNKIEKK